jgi:hypothetical protein
MNIAMALSVTDGRIKFMSEANSSTKVTGKSCRLNRSMQHYRVALGKSDYRQLAADRFETAFARVTAAGFCSRFVS